MITLNPYLVFNHNCEEAFNFYKSVFNGNLLYVGCYKDVPQGDKKLFPNSLGEKVMHATLQLNKHTTIMGCDRVEAVDQPKTGPLNNFYLYVSTDTQEEAYRTFNELSVEGKITMQISQTFWAAHYGMVIDKFGIHWKVTFSAET